MGSSHHSQSVVEAEAHLVVLSSSGLIQQMRLMASLCGRVNLVMDVALWLHPLSKQCSLSSWMKVMVDVGFISKRVVSAYVAELNKDVPCLLVYLSKPKIGTVTYNHVLQIIFSFCRVNTFV